MSPLLREMNPDDVDAILRIEQQVHAHPWTRGNFTDALASGNVCKVYEDGDALLGYAVFMSTVDDAELLDIAIAAEYQRQGLGRRLLLEIMAIARSLLLQRLLLEVRLSNVAALGLYLDVGFNEIGLRRGYYLADNGREDAIVMECIL